MLSQLAVCTTTLLNKTDLVEKEEVERIHNEVKALNPLGEVVETTYSKIDLSLFLKEANQVVEIVDSIESHECKSLKGMENIVLSLGETEESVMDKLLGNMLWVHSEGKNYSVVRMKGIFKDKEGVSYEIQGIHELYEINEAKGVSVSEGKILIIGKNLKENKEFLYDCLNKE